MTFHALDTVDAILAAAARHGVSLAPDTATLDTMGLDFVVVHARDAGGTRWIVRAPRRPDVLAGAASETAILRAVRDHLPVAVPDWRVTDDVIAYPRLDGQPAITLETGAPVWHVIDPAALPPAFIRSLGELLAALARVPAGGLPVRSIDDERAALARTLELARELLPAPDAIVARWRRWLDDDGLWPTHVALSHGDLHPGHLLLAPDATLTGVLDWTEARVGDPGIDLSMVHKCFGDAWFADIVAAYQAAGGVTWPRLVEHAVERTAFFPALGAEWAHRTGNATVMDMVRGELQALLDG